MAHYALVKNGRVIQVIVLEESRKEEVEKFTGDTLIQTSYKTRDGVHYGVDGKPDGEPALRLNYAQMGGYYDKERDIFYDAPLADPTAYNYWDPELMRFFPVMKTNPNGNFSTISQRLPDRTVYMSEEASALFGRYTRAALRDSVGADVTLDPAKSALGLFTDSKQVLTYCQATRGSVVAPMTEEVLAQISNPSAWADFEHLGHQGVPSGVHTRTKLIVASNATGDLHLISADLEAWGEGECQAQQPCRVIPTGLFEAVQAQFKALGIGRSVHTLYFVEDLGRQLLIEWQPWLGEPYQQIYPCVYPVLSDAVLHMLGLPINHYCDGVYRQMKNYASRNWDKDKAVEIGKAGLFAVMDGDTVARVYGIGEENEVLAKFTAIEA